MNEEQILRTGFRQDKALCKTLRTEQTRRAETGQLQDSLPFHRPPAVLPPQLCLSHRSPPSPRSKNQTRMQRILKVIWFCFYFLFPVLRVSNLGFKMPRKSCPQQHLCMPSCSLALKLRHSRRNRFIHTPHWTRYAIWAVSTQKSHHLHNTLCNWQRHTKGVGTATIPVWHVWQHRTVCDFSPKNLATPPSTVALRKKNQTKQAKP